MSLQQHLLYLQATPWGAAPGCLSWEEPRPAQTQPENPDRSNLDAPQLWVGMLWVLPGLWEHAIVPEDVVGIEAQLVLLDVLLDGVGLLLLQARWAAMKPCLQAGCYVS